MVDRGKTLLWFIHNERPLKGRQTTTNHNNDGGRGNTMQMQIKNTLKLGVAVAGLLGAAAGVEAAPVTYNFTSGTASLSLTAPVLGSLLAPNSFSLEGTQVTFDATALQFNSFQFVDTGPTNISGAGALAGATVTITNLNIIPGSGYTTLSASGTNPYNFLVGPVAVSGIYSLSGSLVQGPTPFASSNPSFAGLITLGGVTSLVLNGITLGTLPLPAVLGPPLAGQLATLKADIIFTGVVPVPAAVWLFGSGLGLLGVMRRRMV